MAAPVQAPVPGSGTPTKTAYMQTQFTEAGHIFNLPVLPVHLSPRRVLHLPLQGRLHALHQPLQVVQRQ
eukprot:19114-Eustigmatos_ZCMA.PRE.1